MKCDLLNILRPILIISIMIFAFFIVNDTEKFYVALVPLVSLDTLQEVETKALGDARTATAVADDVRELILDHQKVLSENVSWNEDKAAIEDKMKKFNIRANKFIIGNSKSDVRTFEMEKKQQQLQANVPATAATVAETPDQLRAKQQQLRMLAKQQRGAEAALAEKHFKKQAAAQAAAAAEVALAEERASTLARIESERKAKAAAAASRDQKAFNDVLNAKRAASRDRRRREREAAAAVQKPRDLVEIGFDQYGRAQWAPRGSERARLALGLR